MRRSVDHEALLAIDPATGESVGVARYVRDRREAGAVELAVDLPDDIRAPD